MNIFDLYLIKIKDILKDLSKQNKIILPQNLEGITAEIPPVKFDSDISTNVAMFLAKINKKTPNDIAEILSPILSDNDKQIEKISIAKPGFINIKFKISIKEPIIFEEKSTIQDITDELNRVLEKMIMKRPEQWIWSHNRWK